MSAPPPRPTGLRSGFAALLRARNYRHLLIAGLLSVSGSVVAEVCLVWIVFQRTHSGLDVGLLGASAFAAGVALSLVGGTLADRYHRQRLMVTADLARAVSVGALALLFTFGGFSLPAILVTAFVVQGFAVVFGPAEQATLPAIVRPDQIADANGLVASSRSVVLLAGASVGGLLIVSVGPVAGLFYNVLTFLASALFVGTMSVPRAGGATAGGRRPPFLAELAAGFQWLRREVGLLQLTFSAGLFNFFSTILSTFFVIYATVALHGSALLFAGLLALQFAGSGAAALAVGRTRSVRYAGRVWVVSYGVLAATVALAMGLFPRVEVALPGAFLLGFLGSYAGITWLTYAQLTVPTEMQGRYFGIDGLGSWAVLPAAQIGGGLLLGFVGVATLYVIAGALWLAAGVAFLFPAALAGLRYPRPGPPAPGPPPPGDAGAFRTATFSPGGGSAAPADGGRDRVPPPS